MSTRSPARHTALVMVLLLSACSARSKPEPPPPPLEKITVLPVQVPQRGALAPVVGHVQRYRIAPKDTLLDVARNAGLGFNEVQDANREVDAWIPPAGSDVVVPTRWILPRTRQRGVVINVPEMRMYLFPSKVRPGEQVTMRTWPVAIGETETPSPVGTFSITSKDKNPTWFVPDSIYQTMDKRRRRRVVPPGPDHPMGEYRIRLSTGLYSIHGTDTPWAIGRQTTHGCIRLYPEDIGEFYAIASPSLSGEMVYEPIKFGAAGGRIFVEVHDDVYRHFRKLEVEAFRLARAQGILKQIDDVRLFEAVRARRGVPVDVTRGALPTVLTQRAPEESRGGDRDVLSSAGSPPRVESVRKDPTRRAAPGLRAGRRSRLAR
jgi:L,D-transpeptidase ErfK/SrfK